jgi:hypothetical protein
VAPVAPRRARQSKAPPDCRATTIKSPVTKISLALLSRRDNHLLAATAKLAILCAATLPSRLSRYNAPQLEEFRANYPASGPEIVLCYKGPFGTEDQNHGG